MEALNPIFFKKMKPDKFTVAVQKHCPLSGRLCSKIESMNNKGDSSILKSRALEDPRKTTTVDTELGRNRIRVVSEDPCLKPEFYDQTVWSGVCYRGAVRGAERRSQPLPEPLNNWNLNYSFWDGSSGNVPPLCFSPKNVKELLLCQT